VAGMAGDRTQVTQQDIGDDESLGRFLAVCAGPAIVEGSKDKPNLLMSALSAMGSVVRGIGTVAAVGLTGTAALAGIVSGVESLQSAWGTEYGRIVAEVQSEADAVAGPGKVLIYDRSAPSRRENKRIAAIAGMRLNTVAEMPEWSNGGAFASWPKGNEVCIIMGPDPRNAAEMRFRHHQEGLVKLGDVTDEVTIRNTFYHEVGHCLIGINEGHADAFAALMSIRDGKSNDLLPLLLVSRELDEYTVKGDDSHFTSMSLRWVLEQTSDPAFVEKVRGATMAEIKEIAKSAPTLDSAPGRTAAIRDGLHGLGPSFVVPVEEGLVMTGRWPWLRANSAVPEFRRMVELSDYLSADPAERVVPDAFEVDGKASAEAITAIAATGDPTAAKVSHLFGGTPPEVGSPLAQPMHVARDIPGILIDFDWSTSTVKFDRSGTSFMVKDSETGKAIAAGFLEGGSMRRFDSPSRQADADIGFQPVSVRSGS